MHSCTLQIFTQTQNGESKEESFSIELVEAPEWKIQVYSHPESIRRLSIPKDVTRWLWANWMAYQAESLPENPTHLAVLEHESGENYYLALQSFMFSVGENIRQGEDRFNLLKWLSSSLKFKVLVMGQLLHSGPYASSLHADKTDKDWGVLIDQLSKKLSKKWSCQAVLIKDLATNDSKAAEYWKASAFHELPVDPVMELPIREVWSTFDDYLMDLTSKYRVRYRRARKQANGISRRRIRPAPACQPQAGGEVQKLSSKLDELFKAVRITADFDPIDPPAGYFADLQDTWGDYCHIEGYYLGDRLVGFTTALYDQNCMHAHYLGFEQAVNKSHHIYHNMLFDLIEQAIDWRVDKVNFSRTALEIKSSVGAEAIEYPVLLRANSHLGNWIIRHFTSRVFQAQKWQTRNPFRTS